MASSPMLGLLPRLGGALVAANVATACAPAILGAPPAPAKAPATAVSSKQPRYRPIAVPPTRKYDTLAAHQNAPKLDPPMPGDPGVKVVKNPLESENMATHPELLRGQKIPQRRPVKTEAKSFGLLTATTTHCVWGTSISPFPSTNEFHVMARHTVNTGQTLPYNGSWWPNEVDQIIAPTLKPPNYSALEAMTEYVRYQQVWYTSIVFAVNNHTTSPPSYPVWIDATTTNFANHYLDTNDQYLVVIYKFSGGDDQVVYLWDYVEDAWAEIYAEADGLDGDRNDGWENFEVWYFNYDPGSISEIHMNNLQMDRSDGNGAVWAAKSAVGSIPANSIDLGNADAGMTNVITSWYTHYFYSTNPYLTDWMVENP